MSEPAQLSLTSRLFLSCRLALRLLAGVEEFHCQPKLIATAVALRPGLVRGFALPPSHRIGKIRTAPQFGVALLPAQRPVTQALIHLCRFRLLGRPAGEAAPLADKTFVAEV